jgi:hypothetical protein
MTQVEEDEKRIMEKKWKTPVGFDVRNKRTNWNEHPKKPDQTVIDDLQYSWIKNLTDNKKLKKSLEFAPSAEKQQFVNICKVENYFSDAEFF